MNAQSDTQVAARVALPQHSDVTIDGVRLRAVDEAGCVRQIMTALDRQRGGWVVTVNTDILLRCQIDPHLSSMVRDEATLRVADGMPLVWASRLSGTPLPGRVAGSNLVLSLSAAAAERGRRVFLLGGNPGTQDQPCVAERAAEVLRTRFPDLSMAGTLCPPFGFESDIRELARITLALQPTRPDIVYVALGCPKQERLIAHLRPLLPNTWFLGVGAALSFLAGDVKRAPAWMQAVGLEWAHRLVQEPGRLMRRYLVDDLPYALRLCAGAAVQALRGPKRTPA